MPLSILDVISVTDSGYSLNCMCYPLLFSLHFLHDVWYWTSFFFYKNFACVYVVFIFMQILCTCAYGWMYIGIHRNQRLVSHIFLLFSSLIKFLAKPRAYHYLRLPGQHGTGICLSQPIPTLGLQVCTTTPGFMWVLGIETLIRMLVWQDL